MLGVNEYSVSNRMCKQKHQCNAQFVVSAFVVGVMDQIKFFFFE